MAEQQRMKDAWKIYPRNLHASAYDPLEFDIEEHTKRLAMYSDATGQTEAEVDCAVRYLQGKNGYRKIDLRNVKAVESMLETTTAKSTSTFIAIAHPFSQGHLICREALLKILSFFAVFPAFLQILHTFYSNAWGTRYSGIYSQHCNLPPQNTDGEKVQSEASYVSCFSLRDVEKKEKMDCERRVGAWMSYHPSHNKSAWLFVNASDSFLMRLKDLTQSDSANGIKRSDFQIFQLLLSSVHENWSDYLDHLEQKYQEFKKEGTLSMYSRVTNRPSPIKYAQQLEQELAQLEKPYDFLKANHHVITLMKLGFEKFRRLSAENTAKFAQDAEFVEFAASLEKYLLQTSNHQTRISALKDGYSNVINRILRYNSSQEKQVPMTVEREKKMQFSMATVIAMVVCYPLIFMVGLFSMEYIKETSQGRFVQRTPVFLTFALVMLAAAMGSWLGYKKCTGRGQKPDIETGMLKGREPIVLRAGGTARITVKRVPVGSQAK